MQNRTLCSLILVLFFILSACQSPSPSTQTGDQFLQAIKDADFETAFTLFTPGLQEEIGDVINLAFIFDPEVAKLDSWTYETEAVTTEEGLEGIKLTGTVNLDTGLTSPFYIVLVEVDGQSLVDDFNFAPEIK
jgi:hypothetical protein